MITHRAAHQSNHVARQRHFVDVEQLHVLLAQRLRVGPNPPLVSCYVRDDLSVEGPPSVGHPELKAVNNKTIATKTPHIRKNTFGGKAFGR